MHALYFKRLHRDLDSMLCPTTAARIIASARARHHLMHCTPIAIGDQRSCKL
jgi:hypothetical protein